MSELIYGGRGGLSTVPQIEDVHPLGTNVYVEILSVQETIGTNLDLPGTTEVRVNEAYVLGIGPRVPEEHGLEVGQRVFISGPICFGPDYKDYRFSTEGRKRGVVDYSAIKGMMIEEEVDEE